MRKARYSSNIYQAVREYYLWSYNQYLSDDNIDSLTRIDVLRAYMWRKGIIQYNQDIIEIANLNR